MKIQLTDSWGNTYDGSFESWSKELGTQKYYCAGRDEWTFNKVNVRLSKNNNQYQRSCLFTIKIDNEFFKDHMMVNRSENMNGWLDDHMISDKIMFIYQEPFNAKTFIEYLNDESDVWLTDVDINFRNSLRGYSWDDQLSMAQKYLNDRSGTK
jgi:hypothetical protein